MGHEAIVTSRYKDSVGVWTIGVGVTDAAGAEITPSKYKGSITVPEAVEMFETVLKRYENEVNKAITIPVEQYQFDALVSFHYNTGGIFKSNTRKLINAGKISDGGDAMMGWTRPPEIAARRAKEVSLFHTGEYGNGVVSVYPASASGAVQWSKGKRVNLSGLLKKPDPIPSPKPVNIPREQMREALSEQSRTIQNADQIKSDGVLDKIVGAGSILGPVAGYFTEVDKLVWIIAIAFVGAYIVWRQMRKDKAADKIIDARVDDALSGKHIGRPEATLSAAVEATR